ncbi:MAG: DUF6985 domain-containing protein [Bacillota bacterium]
MDLIRNMQTDDNGWFTTGKFDSNYLFSGEMEVQIFTDDGASIEDAEKCIEHFNGLADKPEVTETIENRLEKFFLYMYDEWAAMGIYDNIVESLKPVMEGYEGGARLSSYLSNPYLNVYPQKGGDTGYGISCDCPWEPEHQCLILIRNDDVLYVGPFEMLFPWSDEKYLHCIWDD